MKKVNAMLHPSITIPSRHKDKPPIVLDIPDVVLQCTSLRGMNQKRAMAYILFRTTIKPEWVFNSGELVKVLPITPRGVLKMCCCFAKKGLFNDKGNKVIPIDPQYQCYGITYEKVHEFTANLSAIYDSLYKKSEIKSSTTIVDSTTIQDILPPTFYNLTPEERGNQLREWIRDGKKELVKKWFAECERDVAIEERIIKQWASRIKREWETEREILQYEALPDPELDELRDTFKRQTRKTFNDRNGINQYNGLQTCPIKLYGGG